MKTIFTLMLMLFCMTGIAQDKIFVHTATPANTSVNLTYIDHPDLNGNPNAGVVYVHAWNPNNLPAVYNNNVTGLYYSYGESKWGIYNEDQSPIVDGSHYMVYIASNPNDVITHVSNAGNQGNYGNITTVIDNPLMNGANPGPYAVMCHYYNPNSVYNPGIFGFYYDVALNKRGIFDESFTNPIPEGAAFRVLINGQGTITFRHTATLANTNGNTTKIDNAALNGNPNATFVFAHYSGSNGPISYTYLETVTSAYYDGSNWNIYNEDTSMNLYEGSTFDIIVAPQTLSVEDNQLATNISMFPNPAKSNVNFNASKRIDNVTIYNMLGQKVLCQDGNATNMQVGVASLSAGSYIAKIKAGNETQTLQLIKE